MKKILALMLALILTLGCMAACTGNGGNSSEKTVVEIVVAGQFGDRSFYDSSKAGGDRLAKDFDNVEVKYIECNNDNHAVQMRNAADIANIVVCVGWEFYDIEAIAPEYPNVSFIWIDNATGESIPNVLNITYAQNEGSFLAGYIAAAMTKTGVVGAVGGEDSDTINDFIVGYAQGAKYANDATKVVWNYVNSAGDPYNDPAQGKECAKALYGKGADVIFQIAGGTGDGVFEAAQEDGFYAIGVDYDQKYINDAVIVCSMKKEVGKSIYDAVAKYLNGDKSLWGTTWVTKLADGYIDIGYGEAGSTQQVPDDVKAAVEDLVKKITSGEITVKTTR